MISNKKFLTVSEITFIAVLSTALGVSWWGWTFLNDVAQIALKPIGFNHLLEGFWLIGSVFFAYIIRKPGSAILGEVVAAFIQGMIAKWGISSLAYGFVQAIPVEILFLCFAYNRWDWKILSVAGMLSALASFVLTYFWYGYESLNPLFNVFQLAIFLLSGAFFCGFIAKKIADLLKKAGVLYQFKISQDE